MQEKACLVRFVEILQKYLFTENRIEHILAIIVNSNFFAKVLLQIIRKIFSSRKKKRKRGKIIFQKKNFKHEKIILLINVISA